MQPVERKIKVIIADDHEIFRDGLKLILSKQKDIELIASVANGDQLIKTAHNLKPDIVVTDIKMPVTDGIEATRYLTANHPDIGIIALSMFDEEDLIMEMLEAGAKGYLLKNADKNEIFEAIDAVYAGENFYCKHTSSKLALMIARSRNKNQHGLNPVNFTDRELDIIQLICKEFTNKEIADKLFISARTVEGYRVKILEKMGVKNAIGIVIYAMQHGIVNLH